MKILIIEDDFASRKLLQGILKSYGESDVAVNGEEALTAFRNALDRGSRYDLLCLDIMMPVMDGQETLEEVRKEEESRGILGLDGVKVIMTTALGDAKNIIKSFKLQCEGYIVKPITRKALVDKLKELQLIEI